MLNILAIILCTLTAIWQLICGNIVWFIMLLVLASANLGCIITRR